MDKEKEQKVKAIFSDNIVIRQEGEEYLVYNRRTDGLYMLSARALEALLSLRDGEGRVERAVGPKDDADLEALRRDTLLTISYMDERGMLREDIKTAPEAVEALGEIRARVEAEPEVAASTRSLIRELGDLTVAAWAIAAKTKGEALS